MKKFIFLIAFLCVCGYASADSLAEILSWKYGNCSDTKQKDPNDLRPNPKMVISGWRCASPQPSEEQIVIDKAEYQAAKQAERLARKNKKQALVTKLGLSRAEVADLIAIIDDRGDD